MNRFLYKCLFVLSISILLACEPSQPINKEAVAESKRRQQIKKLSQAEITEAADALGGYMLKEARERLKVKLDSLCADTLNHQAFCEEKGLSFIDKLYFTKTTVVDRLSIVSTGLGSKELEIMGAYKYSSERGLSAGKNIQKLESSYLYTEPIYQSDYNCLTCPSAHGEESLEENANPLVGMWSVKVSSKELILGM